MYNLQVPEKRLMVNNMHSKFHITGRYMSLFSHFRLLILSGHLPVPVTLWFLASEGSVIKASAEISYRPIN